jgi:hypothetical protein
MITKKAKRKLSNELDPAEWELIELENGKVIYVWIGEDIKYKYCETNEEK